MPLLRLIPHALLMSLALLATLPAPAAAQSNPCQSTWNQIPLPVKQAVNGGRALLNRYLLSNNISQTGIRGCNATTYVGNVLAQQKFVAARVQGQRWHMDLELRGGMATRPLEVHVCLFDSGGTLKRHFTETFNGAAASTGQTFFKRTYGRATGLHPVILLKKQTGTRGYLYRITCTES